jgi:hypothetical protein
MMHLLLWSHMLQESLPGRGDLDQRAQKIFID